MTLDGKFDEVYSRLVTAKNTWEKLINDEGISLVKELMQEFFNSFPEIEELSLIGYTPYFNDGDACTFGLADMDFKLSDKLPEDMREAVNDQGEDSSYYLSHFVKSNPQYKVLADNISSKIKKISKYINDDMFLLLWGDHVKVTFTRDKIVSEEYSHE